MLFDLGDKKGVRNYLLSLVGEDHSLEDLGTELYVKGQTKRSTWEQFIAKQKGEQIPVPQYEDKFKAVVEGDYWIVYINKGGKWIKLH